MSWQLMNRFYFSPSQRRIDANSCIVASNVQDLLPMVLPMWQKVEVRREKN
jgi:hypothetical protein